jgi:hypothetical protein
MTTQGQIISSGVVYWETGFENGYSDITSGGGGMLQYDSGTTMTIVTSPVYDGTYASRAAVVTPPSSGIIHAKAIRYVPMRNYTTGYYGAALYLSPTFNIPTTSDWANIMQLHECTSGSGGNGVFVYLAVIRDSSGIMHLSLRSQEPSSNYVELWRDTNPAPLGQWFTVVFYVQLTSNGIINCWINGNQVSGGPFTGMNLTSTTEYPGPAFDTGIYQSAGCPANYVVSDDMIFASTLEAATP